MSHYAIFNTDNGKTDWLQYVTEAEDAAGAFDTFSDDVLSDTGKEEGWDWHVYEIPKTVDEKGGFGDGGPIYDYVEDRSPITFTS